MGDAIPEDRGEIELRFPSLRFDDPDAGRTQWRFDPSLSFAASSRTSVELGSSFAWFDRLTHPRGGLTGFDVGLNQVIATGGGAVPAISVALDAFIPAGALRSGGIWSQFRAMATGTRGRSRAHLNGAIGTYRVEVVDLGATCQASSLLIKLGLTCDGSAPILPGGPCATVNAPAGQRAALILPHCAQADAAFVSDTAIVIDLVRQSRRGMRWFGGLALDHDIRRTSTLVMVDVSASQLAGLQTRADWTAEVGARQQAGSRAVIEMAIGRRFASARPGWSATGGISWSAR